jgi:predicted amidophosphoribosyltransferase
MDEDAEICPHCGAEFGYYCPDCDREVPVDAVECPHCGAHVDGGFEDEEEEILLARRAEHCARCGSAIHPDDETCPQCSVDLCPDCGAPLGDEDIVCTNCGAEFVYSCPECGADLEANADTCPHCGFVFDMDLEEGDWGEAWEADLQAVASEWDDEWDDDE